MSEKDYWSVTVSLNGERVVTIEPCCLAGREIGEREEKAIRAAAHHLLGFIGDPDPDYHAASPQPSQAGRADKSNDHAPARAESVIQQWHFDDATVERASRAAWPKTWAIIDESPQGCMPNVIARRAITRQKMMDDMRRALFAASPPQPDRNTGEAVTDEMVKRARRAMNERNEYPSKDDMRAAIEAALTSSTPTQTEEEV